MISRIFKAGALAFITIAISYTAASAAESGKCGDNLTWTLDDGGKLTISGTGDMWNYGEYDAPWRKITYHIYKVVLESGVTSIGDNAFHACYELISVEMPDSIISINDDAFYDCRSLKEINIPSSVKFIGNSVFRRCGALEQITIPKGVTSIGDTPFYYCDSLTQITIPNSVDTIGNGLFAYCNSLTDINFEEGNRHFCMENGILFDNSKTILLSCSIKNTVSEYDIPETVVSIGRSAFAGNHSLTDVTIPDGITSIGSFAFNECLSLSKVSIPDSITDIGEFAFHDCVSLTRIKIPNRVTAIKELAFDYCSNLTQIFISEGVKSIGKDAFAYCNSMTDIYYSGNEEEWKKIKIDEGNDPIAAATIHYNSETPTNLSESEDTDTEATPATQQPMQTTEPKPTETTQKETYITQKADEIEVLDSYRIESTSQADEILNNAGKVIADTDELMKMYESADENDRADSADAVNSKLRRIFESLQTVFESTPSAIEGYGDVLSQLRYDLDRLLLRVETEVPKMSVNMITPASGIHIVLRRFYNIYQIGCSVSASSGSASGGVDASIAEGVYTAEANISPETITLVPNADVVVEVRNGSKAVSGIFTVQDMVFTDVPPTHWANAAISELYGKGVVSGTGGGMFTPDAQVTREAFVKMSVTAFGDAYSDGVSGFADDGGAWYSPYIKSAADTGLVTGYADGRFGVGESITRQDIAVILWRRLGQPEAAASSFADNDEIADYAKTAVAYLASQGIINGYEDGTFRPNDNATRAAAAKIIYGVTAE